MTAIMISLLLATLIMGFSLTSLPKLEQSSDVNPFLLGFADDGSSEQIASSFDSATSLSIASDADILNYGQVYIESETYIERCELTDYGDIIFDNSTDNIIRCEGGDDLISLSFGSDQVFGGAGNDEVSIYGDASDYFAQMIGGIRAPQYQFWIFELR